MSLKLDFLSKQQNCVQESILRTINKLENLTLNIHVYYLFKTSFYQKHELCFCIKDILCCCMSSFWQIVTPVPNVKHCKHEWKKYAWKYINFLGLKFKIFHPQDQFIGFSLWLPGKKYFQIPRNNTNLLPVMYHWARGHDLWAFNSPHQRILQKYFVFN